MAIRNNFAIPNRLVIRSDLVPGESVVGYLRRLSIANGFDSLQWMFKSNLSSKEKTYYENILHQVQCITGCDYEILKSHGYIPLLKNDWITDFYGFDVRKKHFAFSSQRICPMCFCEKPIFQSVWDIRAWIACPIHGTHIIDQCPECGRSLSWSQATYMCECGAFEYDDYFTGNSHENVIFCSKHISFLLWRRKEDENTKIDDKVRAFSLENFLDLIVDLYMVPLIEVRSRKTVYASIYKYYGDCLIHSMGIIMNWPDGFYEHVERVVEALLYFRNMEEEKYLTFRLFLCASFIDKMKGIARSVDGDETIWCNKWGDVIVRRHFPNFV
ncbi:TniQ family protein [Azospirillum largimobile]